MTETVAILRTLKEMGIINCQEPANKNVVQEKDKMPEKIAVNATELSKLWSMGYRQTIELLHTLQNMGVPMGVKTLKGWRISREQAIKVMANGTLQAAYDRIHGLDI